MKTLQELIDIEVATELSLLSGQIVVLQADLVVAMSDLLVAQTDLNAAQNEILTKNTVIATLNTQIIELQASLAACQTALDDCQDEEPPLPPSFMWPDASNTGTTGTLVAYTSPMTITAAGTILQNKKLTSKLTVNADNVTIRNCEITGGVLTSDSATNFLMEDCVIIGTGQLCGYEGPGTIRRCEVKGFQNGMRLFGTFTVKANWIHSPQTTTGDPHYDGMEIYGPCLNSLVEDNTIVYADTSDIFISNLWGSINGCIVNHNHLTGADVLCRFEGNKGSGTTTNVSFTNNVCGPSYWQQVDVVQCSPVISGNVDLNGNPLSSTYLQTNQPN